MQRRLENILSRLQPTVLVMISVTCPTELVQNSRDLVCDVIDWVEHCGKQYSCMCRVERCFSKVSAEEASAASTRTRKDHQ